MYEYIRIYVYIFVFIYSSSSLNYTDKMEFFDSFQPSLSSIIPGRFSKQHIVSAQS